MTRTFTLGRYTCVERLGTGPVGELWRAKRFGLIGVERQFLLTRLHPPLAKDAAAVGRLQAALKIYADLEVELLASAESGEDAQGRLVHLHEQAAAPGGADNYVVCEFPGFADLRKLRAGFDLVTQSNRAAELWPAVLQVVARAVSSVLAQAHKHALWHGTLSPATIYLGENGRVQLAELGFAQALPQTGAAWAGDVNFKPLVAYLPKEVQSGTAPGPECDIYALGVIFSDLLVNAGSHGDALRAIADKARAAARNERPQTMRELATAFASLPISPGLLAEAVQTLAKVAQQFQLSGDSVPQPVTVSERSSAEPLPPPPGSKAVVDISKANLGVSGRVRPSVPGAKPGDKDARKAMRDISDISQPPRHVAAPPPETATIARHESEETPLPASRPMLVTHPKLETISPDVPGQKSTPPTEPKSAPDGEKPRTGAQDKPKRQSKDDIRTQKARSGIDWLTSKSDQVPVDEVQKSGAQVPPSAPATAEGAAQKTSSPPRTPTPPAGPAVRRSNPVSINPRARAAAKASASASATTPTAEVDIEEASGADIAIGSPSASTQDELPKSTSTLRDAASALASGTDHLSIGETNPQLAPVKVFPKKSALGEEPTNPVSLEEVAIAASLQEAPAADKPKRRSGPISEPNPRVLSSTAPVEQLKVSGNASASGIPDVLGNTGLAKPVSEGDPLTQDFLVDGVPSAEPRKPRTSLLVGGAVALLLACGLIYLLVAGISQTNTQSKHDGGANAAPDGGTTAKAEKVPADSLVLSTTPPAAVFLDGADKGRTPLTLKVPEGKHKLVLVAELYTLTRRDVTGGTKLDLKLEGAKLPPDVVGEAELKIKCKTEGKLRILVDGNDSGHSCPNDDLKLSPGKHVLSFLDPATDETKEKKIKAKKGKKPAKIKVKY